MVEQSWSGSGGVNSQDFKHAVKTTEVLPGSSTEVHPARNEQDRMKGKKNVTKLKRELGLFSAINLIVGIIIGSGIFISPSIVIRQAGSVWLCLLIWVVCGAISLMGLWLLKIFNLNFMHLSIMESSSKHYTVGFISFPEINLYCFPRTSGNMAGYRGLLLRLILIYLNMIGASAFAELSTLVPRSGGEYAYLLEAYGSLHKFWGPLPSFICAWIYFFVMSPASTSVVILTFSEYICQPFDYYMNNMTAASQTRVKKMIAILGLGLLTYINFVSVKLYVRLQNMFSLCKILVCVVVICAGIYHLCIGNTKNLLNGFEGSTTSPKHLALAFYGCLWSYGGWASVTAVTEEINKPEINIFRSIIIALPLVTAIYVMMNTAYMTVLSIPEMIAAPAVAVVFGDRILGVMSFIIPVGVALSTFGCALSAQFTISRLCYVASSEGHMVQAFSYIHVTRLTPAPAVALQGIMIFIFILAGDVISLIEFAGFLTWIFYAIAMVALIILRRTKADVSRICKVPLCVPILVIAVALFLCLVPIITDPSPRYFVALILIALGFALYVPFVFYKIRPQCMNQLTYFIQVLMEVVPAEQHSD